MFAELSFEKKLNRLARKPLRSAAPLVMNIMHIIIMYISSCTTPVEVMQ
jgi:hypothetical protein